MSFGLHQLLESCVALVALPVFFLAPGYTVLSLTQTGLAQKTAVERILWSLSLSVPLALLCAAHPGIPLPPRFTTAIFVAVAALAVALGIRDSRSTRPAFAWDRHATVATLVALALSPYVLLSVLPVTWRGRLYESAVWQDWNVRTQLVNSAIRGGNTLGNPMFAVAGQAAPLHYYYFWYALCARMHDLVPVEARAVLTASCVGAGFALLAFLFLAVKYLSPSTQPVRLQCSAALVAASILGLDLFGLAINLAHGRFFSDVEFWLDERSPGWLHMILWSPHHVAGLVCCGTALLFVVQAQEVPRKHRLLFGVLAGISLAAAFGTSSFILLLFAGIFAVLAVDAMRRREWGSLQVLSVATVVAIVAAAPFLRGFLAAAASAPSIPSHGHVLSLGVRYMEQSKHFLWLTLQALDPRITHHPTPSDPDFNRIKWLMRLRLPYMLGLLILDLGFFLFVLIARFRQDLHRLPALSRKERVLWLMFLALAVPGTFLSSGGVQGNNDFGRHAGFCLRLVLILWSIPWILAFWHRSAQYRGWQGWRRLPAWTQCAVSFAVLGIASQGLQILLVRIRVPLTDAGLLPRVVVEERVPRVGFRFAQVQTAMSVADRITPFRGIVQGNPHSRLRNVLLLYTNRQMAASDDGCNVPFGGDLRQCLPMSQDLVELFGGTGKHYHGAPRIFTEALPLLPAAMTPQHFVAACTAFHLDTVVATYTDPAWWQRDSWIWQLSPVFGNSTARVFRCPKGSASAQTAVAQTAPLPVH